jgi:hypothetical protein
MMEEINLFYFVLKISTYELLRLSNLCHQLTRMDRITYSLPNNTTKILTSTSRTVSNATSSAADLTKSLIPEQYQIILLSFAYGIISFLSVVGNSSIIYIVIRNRRMHSVTNYFICNLALADCLVACFAVPFQVSFF